MAGKLAPVFNKWHLIAIIAGIYTIALFCPVIWIEDASLPGFSSAIFGYDAVRFEWRDRFLIPQFTNVFLLLSCLSLTVKRHIDAKVLALCGIVTSASAPFIYEVPYGVLMPGYFVWMACPIVLLWGLFILDRVHRKSAHLQAHRTMNL